MKPCKCIPKIALLAIAWVGLPGGDLGRAQSTPFIHPGLLQSQSDLDRIKAAVAAHTQPIWSGYEVFVENPASRANYTPHRPGLEIGRNPSVNFGQFDADATAAYQNALLWAITGDPSHAETAKRIVDGWSASLQRVSGADAVLMAGLGPFKMINAAELLRHTGSGWKEDQARQCERMLRTAIYPALEDFAPFANGNWDTAAEKTLLAMAVYCNDRVLFEKVLRYYVNGAGDGRLTHYIAADGQCQESGRDQGHTQLGLAHLGDCCEIAWHQGLDLYAYADNRLLKGFEYTAKYNLEGEVPYAPEMDRTGKYLHPEISTQGRGRLRPVYEQILNHYVARTGLPAPFIAQAVARIRPEGASAPPADHTGYGTLLYARPPTIPSTAPSQSNREQSSPAAPAGLTARFRSPAPGNPSGKLDQSQRAAIVLTWVAPVGADTYTIRRMSASGGPAEILATRYAGTEFRDFGAQPSLVYAYSVSAANRLGQSPASLTIGCCAGLPPRWQQRSLGSGDSRAGANFDGRTFTLEGVGSGPTASPSDETHFIFSEFGSDDFSLTARILPEPSSQRSRFGLAVRGSLKADAPQVSLVVAPNPAAGIESPSWSVTLFLRSAPATVAEAVGSPFLL